MSVHLRSASQQASPSASFSDWCEVSERGIGSLFGLALLGLMIWGFGYATVKVALASLSSLAEPAFARIVSADGAAWLWAVADGLAMGLFLLFLRWLWRARGRKSYCFTSKKQSAQGATGGATLAAAITAGLLALALNLGALPTAAGGEVDMSQGVPALLESAHFIFAAMGGAGGDGPHPDVIAGWGALLAVLILFVVVGALAGGLTGGGLSALGLGAASGAVESAMIGSVENPRGAAAGISQGAKAGGLVGGLAAMLSLHLTAHIAPAREWGPFVLFDVLIAVATAIVLLLCRRSWSNPSGLWGNSLEAGKACLVLLQYAIGLAIAAAVVGAVLAAASGGLGWLFN